MSAYDPFTYGGFGARFWKAEYLGCHDLNALMDNLGALIDEADRLGVGDWPAAAKAKFLYDSLTDSLGTPKGIYNPLMSTCRNDVFEAQAALESITALLRATPGASLNVPRPDAPPPDSGDPIPMWVKVAGFGVLGVVALHYLSPIIGLVPRRRLAGRSRR